MGPGDREGDRVPLVRLQYDPTPSLESEYKGGTTDSTKQKNTSEHFYCRWTTHRPFGKRNKHKTKFKTNFLGKRNERQEIRSLNRLGTEHGGGE